MKLFHFIRLLAIILFLTPIVPVLTAQDGPPQFVKDAVKAVEVLLSSDGETTIQTFIDKAMVPDQDRDRIALIERLRLMREEASGPFDDLAVEAEQDGVRLILGADGVEKQIKLVLGPEGISEIFLLATSPAIDLRRDNLRANFDLLEAEGMSGLVYIRLGGQLVFEHAFGMANKELGIPNTLNTIFGTGSRPIDYTQAAIYLLDQQSHLDMDDTIDRYFSNVPQDKRLITIRHLMTGQSGLPDFFHTKKDWDPDLAWIDRETAERRILTQKLHFTPGTEREHSHGAFVLLAALIERVTGTLYYGFIREHFLDPAKMMRTGEYGEIRGLTVSNFAAGYGRKSVGLPNIPPNWGPTSWLIKGSGGMYSTLGDLLNFYEYLRSGNVLDHQHAVAFLRPTVNVDGSDRGFELFSAYTPPGNQVYLFLNQKGDLDKMRQLFRALERLAESEQ
jgi:CubicO group peptidase (beta-lactamase class C family)